MLHLVLLSVRPSVCLFCASHLLRYDTIAEFQFNVDSKAE